MKKYLISLVLFACVAAPTFAQNDPGAAAPAKPAGGEASADPQKQAAARDEHAKAVQALKVLNENERSEMQAVEEAAKPDRQKSQEQIKALQDRIKPLQDQVKSLSESAKAAAEAEEAAKDAVRAKYADQKYALMDRVSPGSGARQAQYDKASADLEAQRKKDFDILDASQKAEQAKLQADRKTLSETYAAKKKELQSLLKPLPAK